MELNILRLIWTMENARTGGGQFTGVSHQSRCAEAALRRSGIVVYGPCRIAYVPLTAPWLILAGRMTAVTRSVGYGQLQRDATSRSSIVFCINAGGHAIAT
jgi:hypothetical protein